ncbi:MAG: hypothetical protein HOH33_06050 [Verrucomicrobia bacterium]|jgi:hypothetical protein|nr:hypothetical protein [Verrucomicrobiota bacterium]
MEPYEQDHDDHRSPDPLELHLKNTPQHEVPKTWKAEILTKARKELPLTHNQARIRPEKARVSDPAALWAMLQTFSRLISKITPAQAAMASVWTFFLIGGKVDHWLNASSQASTGPHSTLNLTQTYTQQIRNWELAGLEMEFTTGFEEEDIQAPKQKEKPTPGPRSSLKRSNATSLKVAMGRPCHITLVAFSHPIQDTLEAHPSFKGPLQYLSVGHGPGTVRSTFNIIS